MEEIKLEVQIRNRIGSRKIKSVRSQDQIPAIVYGGKKEPTPIQVDRRSYEKIMRHHRGQNVIFNLNVLDGEKKLRDYAAIVREEQHEPVSYKLIHIDFNRIALDQIIEVKVTIETKGESVGVKKDGGSLEHVLWELDVLCLPTKIPAKIEVDVTNLKIGDAIHVKDIVLPEGVKTKHDLHAIVVTVAAPMKEDQLILQATEKVEVEVTKEKKKDEAPAAAGAKSEAKAEDKGKEKTK